MLFAYHTLLLCHGYKPTQQTVGPPFTLPLLGSSICRDLLEGFSLGQLDAHVAASWRNGNVRFTRVYIDMYPRYKYVKTNIDTQIDQIDRWMDRQISPILVQSKLLTSYVCVYIYYRGKPMIDLPLGYRFYHPFMVISCICRILFHIIQISSITMFGWLNPHI